MVLPSGSEKTPAEVPHVSVVIPHYNDLQRLAACLASLAAQTYPADHIDIIVADNASPQGEDAVRSAVGEHASVILVTDRGAGPARNGGVAASRGEILAFIDSDCIADPDWIAEGVQALEEHDFIGGRVTVQIDNPVKMTGAEAYEAVFAFDFETYIKKRGFTGSGNLFVRRRIFDAVGGFKAEVSEDMEWSHRATGKGFRLGYAPRAVVAHPAREDWAALLVKWRRIQAETLALASTRDRWWRVRWLMKTWAMPVSALAHTPRVLRSDRLPTLRDKLGALGTLYRLRGWRFIDGHRRLLSHKAR